MRAAAGATVLPFPTPARSVLNVLDPGRRAPPPARAPASVQTPAPADGAWGPAPSLLLLAPFFLAPQAGTARDAVAALLAAVAFCLASRAASLAAGRARGGGFGEPAAAAVLALAGAAPLGPAVALALLLFGLLEAARRALGRGAGLALLAAAVPLRFDAGFAALGHGTPPLLLAGGLALGAFLALASAPDGGRRTLWRDLGLLALAASAVSLYAAALLADPWVQRAADVWPLASVPLVLLALLRLWRPRGGEGGAAADPWLVAAGVGWAAVMALALPAAGL